MTVVPTLADLGIVGVKQTLFGRGPDHGEACGNCMQAALATVLCLPLDEVPHFLARAGEEPWDAIWQRMNAWLLEQHGLQLVSLSASGSWAPPPVVHLSVGATVRNSQHVVVAFGGARIFDPHPSDAGLTVVDVHEVFIAARPSTVPSFVGASSCP